MLQKFFGKSISRDNDDQYTFELLEPEPWCPTPIKENHVRVLFCQDAGECNKVILYDSDYATSTASSKNPLNSELARSWNGTSLHHTLTNRANLEGGSLVDRKQEFGPSSMRAVPSMGMPDSHPKQPHRTTSRRLDLIGDMIFGTAPLAYKGMNTKVHYKRGKDPQVVLSKLFTLNSKNSNIGRRPSFSSVNSDRSNASSGIMDDSSDDDQGRYTPSIYPPILGLHARSYSKRSHRFNVTNMENGTFRPMPLPKTRIPEAVDGAPVRSSSRSIKYAVAVIITLEDKNKTLYDFIFSHFALIENHLHQLQAVAFQQLCNYFQRQLNGPSQMQMHKSRHSSYLHSNAFQQDATLIQAVNHFKKAFHDLYATPRIQEPLWLNMATFPHRKSDYSKKLMKELLYLIDELNNKQHHFFISTMFTAVLSHHLSWVQTVAPPEDERNIGCHYGNYDPLWAQLSDLYGYVSTPSTIARTIVVGRKASLVRRVLYILSYLIRCNEVYESLETLSDAESEYIFGREQGLDDTLASKLEDKIVRQLIGSTTDVESIAIPNTQRDVDPQLYNPTESPESLTDHSNATSFSSTPVNNHAFMSSRRSSTDMASVAQEKLWLSKTRDKTGDCGHSDKADSISLHGQESLSRTERTASSSTGTTFQIGLPRSSIFHMEPDITAMKETGVPTGAADRLYAKSYGRSLMASYCENYKSDFVLMGVRNRLSTEALETDTKNTLRQFALTDAITKATCILINTDTLQVSFFL
ncbi:folliculin-interacting protein middle domain-containing protein [Radiomyces spectabilis]|uniref:folliculin-interacting protein middle domain-containing protein n=1 Tax=Radiomyces spectabilis TaxID=64574 RepID=UPI00221F46AB|nr:folliculin-interacting protein middle domain-containing protein [Radiomyces spectabilis]KAI8370554.1 folliculin-interacting protein middle domain-containing protein [Radiomyces spectabilis]